MSVSRQDKKFKSDVRFWLQTHTLGKGADEIFLALLAKDSIS